MHPLGSFCQFLSHLAQPMRLEGLSVFFYINTSAYPAEPNFQQSRNEMKKKVFACSLQQDSTEVTWY